MIIRSATENDIELILYFIKAIAEYEHMSEDVVCSEKDLKYWLFEKKVARVIFAAVDEKEVAFALFFNNFSTFKGKAGIYIEDIFVKPSYRRRGIGKALFNAIAKIALQEGYSRIEWMCLNWNQPSIDFYKKMGAKPLSNWTSFRLEIDAIKEIAKD